jgi:drug/metabolite transporter (DMT)-like permease
MFPSPSLSCCHGAPATVANMTQRLTPGTALLLTIPPLLWAGNAVVGRMAQGLIPPVTLNFLRWALAFAILLPLAGWVLRRSSGLWSHWRRFALLGLLGVGCYNALQYLALKTSTPLNVTLVASSIPLWMLATGALFFGARISRQQLLGAALSMAGVGVVLSRGEWAHLLELRLVTGDLYVLLATACWALYSWLLTRRDEPDAIRSDWAAFLMAQVVFGLGWSGAFAASEWVLDGRPHRLGLADTGHAALRGHRPGGAGLPLLGPGRAARRTGHRRVLFQPHAAVCRTDVGRVSRRDAAHVPRVGVCADRGRNRRFIPALRPVRGQSEGCTGRLNRSPDRRHRPAGCSAR